MPIVYALCIVVAYICCAAFFNAVMQRSWFDRATTRDSLTAFWPILVVVFTVWLVASFFYKYGGIFGGWLNDQLDKSHLGD